MGAGVGKGMLVLCQHADMAKGRQWLTLERLQDCSGQAHALHAHAVFRRLPL